MTNLRTTIYLSITRLIEYIEVEAEDITEEVITREDSKEVSKEDSETPIALKEAIEEVIAATTEEAPEEDIEIEGTKNVRRDVTSIRSLDTSQTNIL